MTAYTRQLIHTCTIQSPSSTARSTSGQENITWGTSATAVPCRYMEMENDRPQEDRTGQFRKRIIIQFKSDVTLATTYRITNVVLEDGTTLAGPFEITEILKRHGRRNLHHLTAEVREA